MGRGRDTQGRYMRGGPMGGAEDFAPQLPMERYLNRIDVDLTFGVDSTVPVFEPVNTGLEVELLGDTGRFGGLKWVLFGATLQPRGKADLLSFSGLSDDHGLFAQICGGAQDALLERSHPQCKAQLQYVAGMTTSGFFQVHFPLVFDILAPMPVLNKRMTVALAGTHDDLALASNVWTVSLLWGVAELGLGDQNALLQTRLLAE